MQAMPKERDLNWTEKIPWWTSLAVFSSMFVFMFGLMIRDTYLDEKYPDRVRSTVGYRGQIKRCVIEYPHQADGKSSFWYGVVNLTRCADGKDISAATDVEILSTPKRSCW